MFPFTLSIHTVIFSQFHSTKRICKLQHLGKLRTKYIVYFLKCYQNITISSLSPPHSIPRESFQSWSFLFIHRDHPGFYISHHPMGSPLPGGPFVQSAACGQGGEAFGFCMGIGGPPVSIPRPDGSPLWLTQRLFLHRTWFSVPEVNPSATATCSLLLCFANPALPALIFHPPPNTSRTIPRISIR